MAPMAWEFDLEANKILRGIEAQVVQIGHIFASGQNHFVHSLFGNLVGDLFY